MFCAFGTCVLRFSLPLVSRITDFDLSGGVQRPTQIEPGAKLPSFLVGALKPIATGAYSRAEEKGRYPEHEASRRLDELLHTPVQFVLLFVVCGAFAHAE